MKKTQIKSKNEIKTYLISQLVVLFFVIIAFIFLLREHLHKVEINNISMLIILSIFIALAISVTITIHAFWKYIKYEKNT